MTDLERAVEYAKEEVAWWEQTTPEQQLKRPRKYLVLALEFQALYREVEAEFGGVKR